MYSTKGLLRSHELRLANTINRSDDGSGAEE
jgi:hypothetical protein